MVLQPNLVSRCALIQPFSVPNLIQNSPAVKTSVRPQKGHCEKRCELEIQGGGQEMAVMVG